MYMYYTHRSVSKIRGFTREILIALAANIETREWRRTFNKSVGIPPEHPRASTTDDVECFFSVLRDNVGKDFTMKQVYTWLMLPTKNNNEITRYLYTNHTVYTVC